MTCRRLAIAAAVLCAVTYLKYTTPQFKEEFVPILHEWLENDQIAIRLPEEVAAWQILN